MADLRHVVAVIDDDDSVRGALLRLFRTAGLEVSPFASAEEYLAHAERAEIDCLVIDVRLPGMSGLELLARVRSESAKPVLIITAHEDEVARTSALAAGAIGFLRKPFDNRQLQDLVFGVLDVRK